MIEAAATLPPDLTALLDPDETILWQGHPPTKLFLFSKSDVFLVPFSLVWAGFAVPGSISTFLWPKSLVELPFALLFLVAGIYFSIGRFFISQRMRKKTVYCVSNKRAFIATYGISGRIDSKPLHPSLAIALEPSEPGSITLGDPALFFPRGYGMGIWSGNDGSFTFRKISDASKVYALIRSVQSGKP